MSYLDSDFDLSDDAARGGCFAISEAYDKYPLAVKLHIADLQATYLMEHRTSNMR